ncbi:hypothetical protein CLAVI_001002 [Candidatus Clavichlamydia salmonicola]|uniref:hypothetical protein n=1 Tax=Candidatus Clavichlamydia salmonicola TaxID=469812 RepID=UPI001890F5EB|nr:hypothetical protein [Candidatus Clavichlamydia salmonicola]MBF5051359.1 hypothetical protein [Candidatus Clavichlamydia salmonicola]
MPYLTLNYYQLSTQQEPMAFIVEETCLDLNDEKIEALNLLIKDILDKHLPCALVPPSFHLDPSLHNNTLKILQDVTFPLLNNFYAHKINPKVTTSLNRLSNTINLCVFGADSSKFLQPVPSISNILKKKPLQHYSKSNTHITQKSKLPLQEISFAKIPRIEIEEDKTALSSPQQDRKDICYPFPSDDEFTKKILENYTFPELTLSFQDFSKDIMFTQKEIQNYFPDQHELSLSLESTKKITSSTQTLNSKISKGKKKKNPTIFSPPQERSLIIDISDNHSSSLTTELSFFQDLKGICSSFSNNDKFSKELLENYTLSKLPPVDQDAITDLEKIASTTLSCPYIKIFSTKNTFIIARKDTSDLCGSLEYLYEGIRHVLDQQIYIFESSSFPSKAHAHQQTVSRLLSLLANNVSLLDLIVNQKDRSACTKEHFSLTNDLKNSLAFCLESTEEITSSIQTVSAQISTDSANCSPIQEISSIINVSAHDNLLAPLKKEFSLKEDVFLKLFFSKKNRIKISRHVAKQYPRWDRFIQLSNECITSATSYICVANIKEIKIKESKEKREILKILYLIISHNYLLYKATGRLKERYEQQLVDLLNQINKRFCKINQEDVQPKMHSSVLLNLVNNATGKNIPLFLKKKIFSPQYHISLKNRSKKNLICIEIPNCSAHTSNEFLRSKAHYQKKTTQCIKKILTLPIINIFANNILNIKDEENVSTTSFIPNLYLLIQCNKQALEKFLNENYSSTSYYQQMKSSIQDSLILLNSFAKTHHILLSDVKLHKINNPLCEIQPSITQEIISFFFPIFYIRSYNFMNVVHYKIYYIIKKSSNVSEQKHYVAASLIHSINASHKLLSDPITKISFYPNPADDNFFVPIRTKTALVQSLYSGFLENFFYYKKNQATLLSSSKRKTVLNALENLLEVLKTKASELSIPLPIMTESVILTNLSKQIDKSLIESAILTNASKQIDKSLTHKSLQKQPPEPSNTSS